MDNEYINWKKCTSRMKRTILFRGTLCHAPSNCQLSIINCQLDLHLLRQRERHRDRPKLLWLTLLLLRPEHLAKHGPDE